MVPVIYQLWRLKATIKTSHHSHCLLQRACSFPSATSSTEVVWQDQQIGCRGNGYRWATRAQRLLDIGISLHANPAANFFQKDSSAIHPRPFHDFHPELFPRSLARSIPLPQYPPPSSRLMSRSSLSFIAKAINFDRESEREREGEKEGRLL